MEKIKQMASQPKGPLIALGAHESTVQIYDLHRREVISEFETVLDYIGIHLAISADGEVCLCAAYHGDITLAAYETRTGKMLWERRYLLGVTSIRVSHTYPNFFFVIFTNNACMLIDIYCGADIEEFENANKMYDSPFQKLGLLDPPKQKQMKLLKNMDPNNILTLDKTSISMDAAFSPGSVAVAHFNGPLNCFDTTDGRLLWSTRFNGDDGQYIRVAYHESAECFLAVGFHFSGEELKEMHCINAHNGTIENKILLGIPDATAFVLEKSLLVTSDRQLIDTLTGKIETF